MSARRDEKSLSYDSFVSGLRRRIAWKIAGLSAGPRPGAPEQLAGYDDRYRIRQGNYRIVYQIDDSRLEVTVFKVGHRNEVCR